MDNNEQTKIEIVEENEDIHFSWAYALWGGIIGFLIHRNNTKRLPFSKSAGVDILVVTFLIGLFSKFTCILCDAHYVFDLIHSLIFMCIWGFVGASRFNKFKLDKIDYEKFKKREKISIIVFLIWIILYFSLQFL